MPIPVPAGVEVTINGSHVTVKGPRGTLEHDAPETITVAREGDELVVTRPDDERENRSLHGLDAIAGGEHGHRRLGRFRA